MKIMHLKIVFTERKQIITGMNFFNFMSYVYKHWI
jgi:hypothetical protein